jgi:hypothetical protein
MDYSYIVPRCFAYRGLFVLSLGLRSMTCMIQLKVFFLLKYQTQEMICIAIEYMVYRML